MANRFIVACSTAVFLIGIGIAPTNAQNGAESFESLGSRVKVGDRVFVQDVSGRAVWGTIVELSPSQLGLAVAGGRADFSKADVDTVSRRDSRWNGTLIGLVIGGALGIWLEGGLAEVYGRDDVARGSMVVPLAVMGTGIGFAVDAAIRGRHVIYSRAHGSTTRPSMAAQWNDRRKAVFVSVRFVGSRADCDTHSTLQPSDRRGVCSLDPPVHRFSREGASLHARRDGDCAVSAPSCFCIETCSAGSSAPSSGFPGLERRSACRWY